MGFELKLSAHVILGIESSCDDTAAAIVSYEKGNSKILSSVVVNQNTLHEKYGGVVPEIAARAHAERVDTASYYSGLFFGPKLKKLDFLQKREAIFIRGENFFNKYGWSGILIGRLIPAIRPFIPFIAGISAMRQPIFLISSIIACFIWTIALAILILGIDNIISFF